MIGSVSDDSEIVGCLILLGNVLMGWPRPDFIGYPTSSRVEPGIKQPQALCMCLSRGMVVENLIKLKMLASYTEIRATSTASETNGRFRKPFSWKPFRKDPVTEQVYIESVG